MKAGTGRMAQGIKALAAKLEDLSSIPGTHMVRESWLQGFS